MLEVYYFDNSICSERVLMTLDEKGIDDWVPHHIHLFKREQFAPEYLKLNPKAQVPTLVHDGTPIRESSLICDYLDDLKPEPPLKPSDLAAKAHMREWIKESDEAGYQGVSVLSFTTIFRANLQKMAERELQAYWAAQIDIDRTHRQQSCFEGGLGSPYAIRALAAWDRIFAKLEVQLTDRRQWMMGDDFTLADLCYAPYVARLDHMSLLAIWLDERPRVGEWWQRLKSRPSYAAAKVGPAPGDDQDAYAREGAKAVDEARRRLHAHRREYAK